MNNYCYYVYNTKKPDQKVVITPYNVRVEYVNGNIMETNICPASLFPGKKKLSKKTQIWIASNSVEGVTYTAHEVASMYKYWKK